MAGSFWGGGGGGGVAVSMEPLVTTSDPKTLGFKGKMANFELTIQLEKKKKQKDKWFHFQACTGGGYLRIF